MHCVKESIIKFSGSIFYNHLKPRETITMPPQVVLGVHVPEDSLVPRPYSQLFNVVQKIGEPGDEAIYLRRHCDGFPRFEMVVKDNLFSAQH